MKPLVLILACVALASCRPFSGPSGSNSITVDLTERDFTNIRNTDARLVFVRPLQDSRCPSDVECISQGDAEIELRIDRPLRQTVFSMSGYIGPEGSDEGAVVSTTADGFLISLLRLDPYPVDSLANNDLYRARLRIDY